MIRLGHLRDDDWNEVLRAAAAQGVTYKAVGATRTAALPAGYHHDDVEAFVEGDGVFERARLGLQSWECHRGAGAEVFPPMLSQGATVLVLLRLGPFVVVAPCRVLYVVDEPTAFGFAYGTLPGHPEEGEEQFMVNVTGADQVRVRIRSFSKPVGPLVRAVAPVARAIQRRTTARYLESLVEFARGEPSASC
jgi:uncharacterized protein (UPF0548 family)